MKGDNMIKSSLYSLRSSGVLRNTINKKLRHKRKGLSTYSGIKNPPTTQKMSGFLATPPADRYVRLDDISVKKSQSGHFPRLGDGIDYSVNIFGEMLSPQEINRIQKAKWGGDSYLPKHVAQPLPGELGALSEITAEMPIVKRDGSEGLIKQNRARKAIHSLSKTLFDDLMTIIKRFKTAKTDKEKDYYANLISDICFETQWLTRAYLFEGKVHGEKFTPDIIPTPLSKLLWASCYASGMSQVEFVYHNYTLLDGQLPSEDPLTVNVENQNDVLEYIASIHARTGFNDVGGGNPEHNFRHNHTFMEAQMRFAFKGWDLVKQGKHNEGLELIVKGARRAHLIFKTMLAGTPANDKEGKIGYATVRMMIAGVLGKAGKMYPDHGVAYEDCGGELFSESLKLTTLQHLSDIKKVAVVDDEFGQTGANSSMYKKLDAILGITKHRGAFIPTDDNLTTIKRVLKKEIPATKLDNDPIIAMQKAFDLYTRPVNALSDLIQTTIDAEKINLNRIEDSSTQMLLFKLGYWISAHRMVHGKYVEKAIYKTTPIGGQSAAQGTGGSTPPFLKTFSDQTLEVIQPIIKYLDQVEGRLSLEDRLFYDSAKKELIHHDLTMGKIRQRGIEIEKREKQQS